jgi:hypothetical protein
MDRLLKPPDEPISLVKTRRGSYGKFFKIWFLLNLLLLTQHFQSQSGGLIVASFNYTKTNEKSYLVLFCFLFFSIRF